MRPLAKLLFVDDERATRTAFTRFMTRHGFAVDIANSGQLALKMAREANYAVVIADWHMPGMDGVRFLERLAEDDPEMALVLTTGDPTPELFERAATGQPSFAILSKPWDWDSVIETISRATTRSESPETRQRQPLLILEDNPADLDLLTEYIEIAHGDRFEVEHSTHLHRALDLLREPARRPPAAILADLSLPDSFGLLTVDQLYRASPSSAIIVVSGNDDEELAIDAVRAGAQDYLVKGEIDARTLKRSIRYSLERKAAELRLSQLAHFDQLTGVANRITFNERLVQMLSRAKRKQARLGVMYIDLDHFKEVNDVHGHAAGDELLTQAAKRIGEALRDYDTVARLGGDEFAVLVDDPANDSVSIIAGRIVEAMARPFDLAAATVNISSSVGVAVFPSDGGEAQTLLSAADEAMYHAKKAGRNQFQLSPATPASGSATGLTLVAQAR